MSVHVLPQIHPSRFVRKVSEKESRWTYCHPQTGRKFDIIQVNNEGDPDKFWMTELIPNGRMIEVFGDKVIDGWEEPKLKAFRQDPNRFWEQVTESGLNPNQVVLVGAGFSVDSRYFQSMQACADEIATSIEGNTWFSSRRELSQDEIDAMELNRLKGSVLYWKSRLAQMERVQDNGVGILKGFSNGMGHPISDSLKKSLLSYLNDPNQNDWNRMRSHLITPSKTLWQAWVAHDSSAPFSGDRGFPDADTLRNILETVLDKERDKIKQQLHDAEERLALEAPDIEARMVNHEESTKFPGAS